jgi:hypothetical protein
MVALKIWRVKCRNQGGKIQERGKKKRSYELNQKSVGDTRYLEMEG